jgi:hypothetical protein
MIRFTRVLFVFLCVATVGAADLIVTWDKPATYTDDSPVTDLAGVRLYWGNTPGVYDNRLDVGLTNIGVIAKIDTARVYWIVATAYTSDGVESDFSLPLRWPSDPVATVFQQRMRIRIAQ